MLEFVKQIVIGQFEASLAMLAECVRMCPAEHFEEKIATITFRQVAYHALFFADLYLSPNEHAFAVRDIHAAGGDERRPFPSPGLGNEDCLAYAAICREKAREALLVETQESLAGPSGFSWYKCSRGELHVINIRHLQHHTGQLSAYLRRIDQAFQDREVLRWVATGWR
ncbi:MAG: DinB family protein [Pirellulales bacterium]